MYRRSLDNRVQEALADTPVVLIHGARQVGKTTLAEMVGGKDRQRFTLDRTPVLAAATADPDGFIDGLTGPVFIDEIQRAPQLFPAIKHAVDRDRRPGRFLLTGSANVLMLPKLSESLAGRMEVCTLWPLTQAEIEGQDSNGFIDLLFSTRPVPAVRPIGMPDIWERVLRGGFPEAVQRSQPDRRRSWFESYVDTLLQRDIRELASIDRYTEMPRLLQLLGARSSGLLSYSDLATGLTLSQSSVKRYVGLLEAVFLLRLLPAWTANLSGRVIKSPKVHLIDSGLTAALLGVDRARLDSDGGFRGLLLESFITMELVKLAGTSQIRPKLYHFRTVHGREVDVVLESPDGRIVGVEIKAGSTVDKVAFRGIEALREAAGDRFHRGVVLYGGDQVVPFGRDLFAVPLQGLWGEVTGN